MCSEGFRKAKERYDKARKEFMAMRGGVEGVYDHDLTNELVYRVKRGDVEAKEELVGLHRDFIKGCVDRFKKVSKRCEAELIEGANVGFVQAALDFDEGSGHTFIAYALWYINRGIVEVMLDVRSRFITSDTVN